MAKHRLSPIYAVLLIPIGKNVSLVWKLQALNTFKLPSYYPSFDNEMPDGLYSKL